MTAYDDIRAATDLAEQQHIQVVQMLAEAGDTIAEQQATINGLTAENDELKKALEECEEGHPPDPEPEPPVVTQRVGGCPAGGGDSANAAGTVVSKWGAGCSVRVFTGNDLRTVAPRPATAGRVHMSWKPLNGQPMTEESVRAACINLVAGDMITVEHEADVKYLNAGGTSGAQAQLDQRKQLQTELHRLKNIVRPDLVSVCVLAGWRFREEATGNQAPDKYLTEADLLGVDLDGVNTSYYDWRQCLPRIAETVIAFGYDGWTCPEFGWPRLSTDSSGSQRTAAINAQMPAVLAAGPVGVEFFDYNTYTLTLNNERAAWQAFVNQHAA